MKNSIKIIALFIISFSLVITGCKKDKTPVPEKPKPTIVNVEIGLSNNEIGVIGKDFHLNADIIAGDKIENVQIKILPKTGETYTKPWKFELTWEEFKGVKNTNVHKHFNIPSDAVEGKYDFIIIVNDQNGSKLEEKRNITIYSEANLPVNPEISTFALRNKEDETPIFDYKQGGFYNPIAKSYGSGSNKLIKNIKISIAGGIKGIKGDGKAYIVLINKKHNHKPEAINSIDFSKAIVWSVFEHKDKASLGSFTNVTLDRTRIPYITLTPTLEIGAANDNNAPIPNPITGLKAWETGNYYLGIIYKNTTHNIGLFNYIEVAINMN